MRKQCYSNFFQGVLFQVSLVWSCDCDGAFLSFIVLAFYLPYSRVHVSLSPGFPRGLCFLGHRPTGGIGWHLLAHSTWSCKSRPAVSPFQSSVLRYPRCVPVHRAPS